jgi:membrane-anchored mycosin MYCP
MSGVDLKGKHKAFSRAEIAVALKHLDRVVAALDDRDVQYEPEIKRDPDLGLALIQLKNDAAAAGAFHAYDPKWRENFGTATAPKGPTRSGGTAAYLDSFLRGLRGYFAREYAGWKPVVGKNRLVGYVTGAPGRVTHGSQDSVIATASSGFADRTGSRGTGVRVGVLDTAISPHPWFEGAWTSPGTEVLKPEPPPNAEGGHGTFVAGLILDKAPNCVVEARRVLDPQSGEATSWEVAQAIVAMARTKPDVINLSLVCYTEDGEPPMVLATAIDRVDPDIVIVAAAGNHGNLTLAELKLTKEDVDEFRKELAKYDVEASTLPDPELKEMLRRRESRKPGWPAAFDRVVAVGSAKAANEVSASTPSDVEWIDVLAEGDKVTSTFLGAAMVVPLNGSKLKRRVKKFPNRFAKWSGTSFAAASVSGAIAARTVPGRVSAQQAWARMLDEVKSAPTNTLAGPAEKPYFLKLDAPEPDA